MTKKTYISPSLRVIMIKDADIIAQSPMQLYSVEPEPAPDPNPAPENVWGIQW